MRNEPFWWITKDGDKSCLELYKRHYSAKKAYADGRERYQFVGPGYNIVLRTARADALFVWRDYIDDTLPKQVGIECAVFRNESAITSSKLIRQADAIADHAWPCRRHYTKVNPEAVGSDYPGWCFIRAGWRQCGETAGGLLIFERRRKMKVEPSKRQIQAAIDVMNDHGIDFRAPWECTLDDREQERFEALRDAIGAALALHNSPKPIPSLSDINPTIDKPSGYPIEHGRKEGGDV